MKIPCHPPFGLLTSIVRVGSQKDTDRWWRLLQSRRLRLKVLTGPVEMEPQPCSKRPRIMATSTIIDIPHTLGRDEAKRRMIKGVGKLASHIPGGAASVTHSWPSADRLALTVFAMGVEVPCTIDSEDNRLRVILHLPGMLSLMSGAIAAIVEKQGQRLMLDDKASKTM